LLWSSPPVYPNFDHISIKDGREKEPEKGFMYCSIPNEPSEWQADTPGKVYLINITEQLISSNQHLEYSFLTYGLHEPLYLKQEEETITTQLFKSALHEYHKAAFSEELTLAYCNLIFAHVAQCYKRQFGERKAQYNQLVSDFFSLLEGYYQGGEKTVQPSVSHFANELNITPNYLSDIVKFYSGKPALEHIHQHIVKVAKSLLDQKKNQHFRNRLPAWV